MNQCLILYASIDGQTKRICDYISALLNQRSITTTVLSISSKIDNLDYYDSIIIGASIRYGVHQKSVYNFIKNNRQKLDLKKNAFFSVNVVARKEKKNSPDTNPYIKKFLKKTSWKPEKLAVFAGKIDYPKYGFFDRHIIRLIMWITNGPTNILGTYEFTDWDIVKIFAQKF